MATEVVKRLINVDEYHKMAEMGILKPDDRLELIQGEIYEMSPIGSKHAGIVNKLAGLLNELFKNKAVTGVQNPVQIDDRNEPEPDISLLKYRSDYYSSAHPVPADVLAIIEVSDASIRFDKDVKLPLYATHRIPEYWIIDLESNRIEVYANPKEGTYTSIQRYLPGEEITLMDQKLPVNEVLLLS
ncbi:Endonuclease, Uma2 family (restriction endonuclease fold) [Cyclobacterium lianum]|uniref:Endonuclease, Uma2 family (Restriction endonuclease fold) n=1 Tax=Cyclobacterium lianum TaxID=388280 RepID=A0A1M7N824_9BACT|nr:Uma2 family endonuclease [Cyclobacterium lianum]SHM99211.1 Endonuclease, Uma2 family (restriction endonuclease fold) [Cyclobacterium lianum]